MAELGMVDALDDEQRNELDQIEAGTPRPGALDQGRHRRRQERGLRTAHRDRDGRAGYADARTHRIAIQGEAQQIPASSGTGATSLRC